METPKPLTRQQRDSLIAEISSTVAPAAVPKRSILEQAMDWKSQIIHLHKKGYSREQIAKMLADPRINVPATDSVVKKVLAGANHRTATRSSNGQSSVGTGSGANPAKS